MKEAFEIEIVKCRDNPYYFATNYLTVNGKPFTTPLSEKAFNSYFNNKEKINVQHETLYPYRPLLKDYFFKTYNFYIN